MISYMALYHVQLEKVDRNSLLSAVIVSLKNHPNGNLCKYRRLPETPESLEAKIKEAYPTYDEDPYEYVEEFFNQRGIKIISTTDSNKTELDYGSGTNPSIHLYTDGNGFQYYKAVKAVSADELEKRNIMSVDGGRRKSKKRRRQKSRKNTNINRNKHTRRRKR
jgi:hypothetical protein